MAAALTDPYQWDGAPHGLQLGVRVVPAVLHKGGAVNVTVAVRNNSMTSLHVEPQFGLVVERDARIEEQVGGPRSTAPIMLSGGAMLEILGWQLDREQLGEDAGDCLVWAVYRPTGGQELRSGKARITVMA